MSIADCASQCPPANTPSPTRKSPPHPPLQRARRSVLVQVAGCKATCLCHRATGLCKAIRCAPERPRGHPRERHAAMSAAPARQACSSPGAYLCAPERARSWRYLEPGSSCQRLQRRRHQCGRRMIGNIDRRVSQANPDRQTLIPPWTIRRHHHARKTRIALPTAQFSAPPIQLARANVGILRNLRHDCARREGARQKFTLCRIAPATPSIIARNYRDLAQCIILAPVQTPALAPVLVSRHGITSARRPSTDAYHASNDGAAIASTALPGPDPLGDAVPVASSKRKTPVPHARGKQSGRTAGK